MKRRKFFKVGAAGLLTSATVPFALGANDKPASASIFQNSPDIVVISAGVFGLWSDYSRGVWG